MVALSERSEEQGNVCVLVLGHGTIGRALVLALRTTNSPVALVNVADPQVKDAFQVDVLAEPNLIRNYHYVINTIPLHSPDRLVPLLVACIKHGVHYLDTNEDRQIGQMVRMISTGQKDILLAPHCGLAPGTINVMGAHMHRHWGCPEIDLRVGALTRIVDNPYLYTPTWSPAGLVNQSLNDFDVIEHSKHKVYQSVFSREAQDRIGHFQQFYDHFYIDGVHYECFPTSGGLGTMTEMADLGVKNLMYRTIRLHKHGDALRTLIHAYAFDRPSIIKTLDEHRMSEADDFVYTIVRTNGPDRDHRHIWVMKAEPGEYLGIPMTAIQKCTVGGVAAVLDLHVQGSIPSGFLHQHEIDWEQYVNSQFIRAIDYRGSRHGHG